MVSFSCDLCADIIKKPKLVQHLYRCPNAKFTCIDCSTTFSDNSYSTHTSCISEAEKYQKGLYKGNKKNKQDQIHNKRKQNLGTPDNKSREISIELNKTPNKNDNNNDNNSSKFLESSGQNQTPNSTKDNHNNQEPKDNSSKKKKNKKKKKQQQGHQNKDGNNEEEEGEKEVQTIIDDGKKVQELADTTTKQDNKKDDSVLNNSPKKKKNKKKSSVNNINSNDNKVEESKKDNNVSDVALVITGSNETGKAIETPKQAKKESNTENLDKSKSSSNKKKKVKNGLTHNNNRTDDKQSDETKKDSTDSSVDTFIGIMKKEHSDKKEKKRKSVEFVLPEQNEPETPTKKKQKVNIGKAKDKKKSKIDHENDITHNLTNYHENISASIKKIFESNKNDELNLKRLEEMVVRELISNSNLSENELKEKFLENIVLTMKDGKIILK